MNKSHEAHLASNADSRTLFQRAIWTRKTDLAIRVQQ